MGGWGGMEDAELEEGEAAFYTNKDGVDNHTGIDPEIALSYIGEKLQTVLGHFQKDFEGGVSAETLGAKYGGYGSFLPMYQRSPQTGSNPKTPLRVQNHSTSRSPGNLLTEGVPQNFTALLDPPTFQTRRTSASSNTDLLNKSKSSSGNGLARQESCQVADKISAKHEPSFCKLVDPLEQKRITVRIKVNSDKGEAQRNAALYSGLGLTSPSSSGGNSPEESCGTPISSQETPSDSTAGILQILTSFPVAGDLLLSPLHENLLSLIRSGKASVDGKPAASVKGMLSNSLGSADNPASMLGTEELLKGKRSKFLRMETIEQVKYEDQMHCESLDSRQSFPDDKSNRNRSDSVFDIDLSIKGSAPAPESFRQPEQNMPVKKRDLNKDRVKNKSLASHLTKQETLKSLHAQDSGEHEHQESKSGLIEKLGEQRVKSSQKGRSIDLKEDSRSKGNIISASVKANSDVFEGKLVSVDPISQLQRRGGLKAASHECHESGMPNAKKSASKKVSSEGKKKLKQSQINGKPTSDLADASLKSGLRAVKDKKSAQKVVNKVRNSYKDLFDTRLDHVNNHTDMSSRPSVDKSKDSSHEGIAAKDGFVDKYKESSSLQNFNNQPGSEMSVKKPLTDHVPSATGLMSGVVSEPVAPVLIEEHWVLCDRCEQWRLLPPGTKPEQLPEKWLCSMLNWLPGMNRCDITEDETTRAVQAKYHGPPLEIQNNIQNNVDIRQFDQIHQNVGSQYMSSEGKKKFKLKEPFRTGDGSGPTVSPHLTKNSAVDVVRSISLKNMNQPHAEANLIDKSNIKHLKKSYKAVEKHSNNPEENGDAKPRKKIKRERESSHSEQGRVKKSITEVSLGMDDMCTSEHDGNFGRRGVSSSTGFPTKAVLKDKQKQINQRESEKLQICVKIRRDSSQCSLDNGCSDVKTDRRGISTKKRKVMDGQDYSERMQSDGKQFGDNKVSLNDDSGDSGFRRAKKFKLLESEGKGFSKKKADDKLKRGTENPMLLTGNRADTGDENVQKAQQLKAKMTSGLTLEDIEVMKKDLGSELFPTAANSSSSKVSDSHRSRVNYQEARGSPVESVSSSPMRTSYMKKHSPAIIRGSVKDDRKSGDPMVGSLRRSLYGDDISESNKSGTAMKKRVSGVSHRESFETPMLESRENDVRGKVVTVLSKSADVQLGNTNAETSGKHSLCPSKVRMSKNHNADMLNQKKSGMVSSAQFKENDKASASSFERLADKVSDLASDQDVLHRKKFSREETEIKQNYRASCHVEAANMNHPFSDESGLKEFRNDDNVTQKDSGKGTGSGKRGDSIRQSQPKHGECDRSDVKEGALCSLNGRPYSSRNIRESEAGTANGSVSNQVEARNGKLQISSQDDKEKCFFPSGCKSGTESQRGNSSNIHVQPFDASAGREGLKVLKTAGNAVHQNGNYASMSRSASDQCVVQVFSGPSHTLKESPAQSASSALNEAEKLRDYADRLKDSGFVFECNEAYFQAALMFLHGASLLESSESNKHGEMNQMQIYTATAKLCETCALEYEKCQEMAAAALAYKCMEVAHMRVASCKNSSTNRVWHDLQASLQIIPQNESPSSSASDIDNLNSQIAAEKAALSKGNGPLAGNHIIAPRNRANFVRLLDFTKDPISAMEASRKSQKAFAAAATMILEQAQNNDIIISVKRAIEFSYQDVEEFVRRVRHAVGAIGRGGFGGS